MCHYEMTFFARRLKIVFVVIVCKRVLIFVIVSLVAVGCRWVPVSLDPHQGGEPEPVCALGNNQERVQEDTASGKSISVENQTSINRQ
jgi:hypothetical protein